MKRASLFALTVAICLPFASASAQAPNPALGTWINPHGTVAVEIAPCAGMLCGRVVWASNEAIEDARDSGVPKLIGTELLENYHPTDDGTWSGHVYVPDMGGHYASTITVLSPDRLEIKGCMLGHILCKSQVWQRHSGRFGS